MYEEPTNLLVQEFRNISSYNAILDAVASGKQKLRDIVDVTHLEQSTVSHALRNLISTGIVDSKKTYQANYLLSKFFIGLLSSIAVQFFV